MGVVFVVNSAEEMCDLMCGNYGKIRREESEDMGRGSSKAGAKLTEQERAAKVVSDAEKKYGGSMETPYDEWGEMLSVYHGNDTVDLTYIDDEGRKTWFGNVTDSYGYVQEPDIRPVTRAQALKEIDAWRMDDGTYGDEDTHFGIAYDNGDYVDVSELNGKAYKRRGVVGVHITTPDYEIVWGGERNRRTGKIEPYETWEADGGAGHQNSYSGYKSVGKYKIRTISYARSAVGEKGYGTVSKIIKKSKVRPM